LYFQIFSEIFFEKIVIIVKTSKDMKNTKPKTSKTLRQLAGTAKSKTKVKKRRFYNSEGGRYYQICATCQN
jgi:hypothetical protein